MERFDIRKHKYLLTLIFIFLLFIMLVANAYKFLPQNIDTQKTENEQVYEQEKQNVNSSTDNIESSEDIEPEISSEDNLTEDFEELIN